MEQITNWGEMAARFKLAGSILKEYRDNLHLLIGPPAASGRHRGVRNPDPNDVWRQLDVAFACPVNLSLYQALEAGRRQPVSPPLLWQIASFLRMPNEVARWVFDLREIALPAQAHTMASITPEEANKWIQMVHPELPALLVNACQDIIEYNLAACLAFRLDPASVKEKYRDKYSNVLRLIFTRQAMALIGNWEDHAIEALQDFKLAWARYGHEDCARFQEVADSLPRMGRLLLQKPDLIALQRVKTIRNAEGSEFRLHQRSVALSGGLKLIVYEALDADTRMWLEGLAVRELSRDIEEFKDQPHRIGGTVDIKAEQRGAPSDTDRSAIIDEYAKGRAELHEEDEDGEIGADLEDEAE